jgi:hypothetical protein
MREQNIFSELLVRLRSLYPDDVYDGTLPPDGTPYPFIYLGESLGIKKQVKGSGTCSVGSMTLTLHVYHNNVRQRGTLSGITEDIEAVCYSLESAVCTGFSVQILPDETTAEPLLHAVITADFI